uniref:RNA-directed DNA polymerase n=1 Tax=Heterorhabditis bacteriophora TaxID=37862 RepID=A0A1I7XMT2_HETBA
MLNKYNYGLMVECVYEGLTKVVGQHIAYLDDIIVTGKDEAEHQVNLNAVFQRIEEFGFNIRLDKCNFALPEIEAIRKMPPPNDVSSLRSFLGIINCYSSFVKNMHSYCGSLDDLLKKDAEWQNIKPILQSDLLFTHYDPQRDIIVVANASNYGIGAVISHKYPNGSEKAIMHVSRSLTKAEKNYGQIEKEGLALVFAVKKFHRMLHGRHFILLTDHKPLLSIFGLKKGIPVYTENRLQRWATTLLPYDFQIEYRATTSFGQADALSRLIADQNKQLNKEDLVIAAISTDQSDSVRALPANDKNKCFTTGGDTLPPKFLAKSHQMSSPHGLFSMPRLLSIIENCLLSAERVAVPGVLKNRVLRQLHMGHPEIVRMKYLARCFAFWPGIDKDIENMVRSCTKCAIASKNPTKTTLSCKA